MRGLGQKGGLFLGARAVSPRLLWSGPRTPVFAPSILGCVFPLTNCPAGFALVGLSAGFLPLSKSSRALHSSVLREGLWNWID